MKRIIIIVLLVLTGITNSFAQQLPQFTQYMYNTISINPAYAGSREALSIVALNRNQWAGFDGGPQTMTLSAHTPLNNEKVGVGLSFVKDELGYQEFTSIYADFSYTIGLGGDHKLAFGLKGGVTLHDIGLFSDVDTALPGDPLYGNDVSSATPNAGAGLFFYSDKYYVGLSTPNMIKSVHLDEDGAKYGTEELHYFLTAGYVFQLTENTKFKPSFLVKSSFEAPISFDINANFLFYDKFEIGASYRNEDSFSGLVGFAFTDSIRVGYAYDHILTDISEAAKGSHEVFLQFDLNFPKKVSRSPRFF